MTTLTTTWRITQPTVSELREPLLELWHRNLPDASRDRFDWLYGTGRAEALLLGEPEVSGSAGLMRRRFAVNGSMVEAGAVIDLNVDESQRAIGPALALARAVIALADRDQFALLYGLPIRAASAVLKRAGYRQVGECSNWTKLLRSESKLQKALRSHLAARIAAPFVDLGLRMRAGGWMNRLPANIIGRSVSRFDERFDRLWQQVAEQYDVIGDRSADYLSWRFTDCHDVAYRIFVLVDRTSEALLGYVVWFAAHDGIVISDLLAKDVSTTTQLLGEFSRFARRANTAAIRFTCFGPPEFYQSLQAAGFSRRQNGLPILVRVSRPLGDNWYVTMADHDTDV